MKTKKLFITAIMAVLIMAGCTEKPDPLVKSVSVAEQNGTMTAKTAGSSVTFAVTTANIADGEYDAVVANLPTGVTASGKISLASNKGTLTLTGSASAEEGEYTALTLTIDKTASKAFTLIVSSETAKSVSVAEQFGVMTAKTAGSSVTFAVTTANIADGEYDAVVANLPAGVTASGKVSIASNEGTLTLTGSASAEEGEYSTLRLTIDNTASNVFTLNISPSTAKSVSVGAQNSTLAAGISAGEAAEGWTSFNVTTTNIANGSYSITVLNLPAGLMAETPLTIYDGEGTLLLQGYGNQAVGTYSTLRLTIDGVQSEPFTLIITDEGVMINGVKWATRNVDAFGTFAATPESAGCFYQWNRPTAWAATGDVTGWDNTYAEGVTWETANDPCPNGWRVPTIYELNLLEDVTHTWTTRGGINGMLFGDGSNTIFLPAVGCRASTGTFDVGTGGYYWSSTKDESVYARYLCFYNDYTVSYISNVARACPVRCVKE